MAEDKDSWASIIRACVLTSKTPLTPLEVNRDTKMLEGNNIPYTKLGYHTLEDLLRSIPGLQVFQQGGRTVVKLIPNEKTAHIQRMVRAQKSSKPKKRPRTLPTYMNRMNTAYRNPAMHRMQMSAPRNGVQNRFNQQSRPVPNQNFNRPTTLNYQPLHKPKPTPILPSPLVQPQNKTSSTPVKPQTRTPSTPVQPLTRASIIPNPPITPVSSSINNTTPLLRQPTTNRPVHATTPILTPSQPKTVTFAPNVETQKPLSAQQRLQLARQEEAPIVRPAPTPVTPTPVIKNLSERLMAAKIGVLDDPRLQLLQYTKNKNLLDPKYKPVTIVKDKNHYSAVTIEKDRKFSSYPTPAKTIEEAEKIAARKALENLLPQYDVPDVITQDKNLLLQRVTEIVNNHPNGILETGVVQKYESRFNEKLPEDWLNFVKNYIKVDVGANDDVRFLCPQKEILHIPSPHEESINKKSASSPDLDILDYQNLDTFYFNIMNALSTTDIWGIINDENHSDKLYDLAQEMRPFYENNNITVKNIQQESYYTIFDSEWHRVYCLEYNKEKEEATVFFIDRGDSDVFPANRLRTLIPEFLKLPWQAVRISLKDLELFEDLNEAQGILEDLIDKDVLVKSAVRDPDAKGKNLSFISVELESVDDKCVDINESISKCILEKVNPILYIEPDKITQEVHISFVSEQSIYVQVILKGKQQLDRLIDQVRKDILENVYHKTRPVTQFDMSKVYMTKSKDDNEWYRVKLINVINDKEAKAFCIDFGHEMTVKKTDLVLDDLPELLTSFPAQAVKVSLYKMSKFTFDERILNHLRKLAPRTEVFYMKVMDLLDKIPVVNFYQRTENNLLASLNDTLIMEQEITESRDDNNNARRSRNASYFIGGKNDFPLPMPKISAVGFEYDVRVTMAAHPGNFTIQPLNSAQDLDNMMAELSKVCQSYTGPTLTPSSIKTGTMYAAKYDGGDKWYRGYASKILSKNVCVIYYVDYGDYRTVTTEQLQILDKRFLTLPYQALKAKLYGIEPKLKGDWSVEDSLRFIELTVDKNLVSIVKSIESDTTNISGMIMGLELIDTSTAENIYISEVLVKEKRAENIKKSES